ncbi:MAG TPA: hypothetical protein VJH20_04570 [Candidatus Nanoarchaeia archaeon]|nr:hypothetical protein [Candidatus Nanoarchaeia archaeon]
MELNGLLLAYDGIDRANVLKYIDAPFYGGLKYLMLEKIMNPTIALKNGNPLISNPLKALLDSTDLTEIVIACHHSSRSRLEEMATTSNKQRKKLKIVEANGHVGNIVQQAIDNFSNSNPIFLMLPDLPLVTGEDVDFVVKDLSYRIDQSADAYIPVIPTDYLHLGFFKEKQRRIGIPIRDNGKPRSFAFLNFLIFDPKSHNPTFTRQFYHSRTFRTLSGFSGIIKNIPLELVREIAMKRLRQDLNFEDLENVGKILSGRTIKIVRCYDPGYLPFVYDIDTKSDYVGYLKS